LETKKNSILRSTSNVLSILISIGLLIVIAYTALAFGTVEAWSVAIFSLLTTTLSLFWGGKCLIDRGLIVTVPAIAWPLLIFAGYGVLQTITRVDASGKRFAISLDVEATRLTLEVVFVLLVSLLLFATFFADAQRLAWLRNFLIFFGLAISIFGLVQKFTWNGKYYWFFAPSVPTETPFGPFVNRNHFAGYLEMIVPVPVGLILLRAVRGELSFFYGFAAVMMSVAIFVSLSRGGMISVMASLIFVIAFGVKPLTERLADLGAGRWSLRYSGLFPRIGAVVLIMLTIGFGVWWIAGDAVIERAERTELTSEARGDAGRETFFQSRGWIWRDTMGMIRDNWVVGVGLGAYETAYPLYGKRDGTLIVSQAHNDYLQILADCGLVGSAIALWFLIVLFRDFARALSHRDEMMVGMALGCGGGVVAMLVHSLFDFNLQLPSNALLFLTLAAVVSNIGSAAISGEVSPALLNRAERLSVVA
jgi:O-antigen ligase